MFHYSINETSDNLSVNSWICRSELINAEAAVRSHGNYFPQRIDPYLASWVFWKDDKVMIWAQWQLCVLSHLVMCKQTKYEPAARHRRAVTLTQAFALAACGAPVARRGAMNGLGVPAVGAALRPVETPAELHLHRAHRVPWRVQDKTQRRRRSLYVRFYCPCVSGSQTSPGRIQGDNTENKKTKTMF